MITLALVLLAMWYAAVSQNNAMAYLLLFFLGSLTVLSAMNYTHFNLVGLRLDIWPDRAGFRRLRCPRMPLEIHNPSRRERHALELVVQTREQRNYIASVPGPGQPMHRLACWWRQRSAVSTRCRASRCARFTRWDFSRVGNIA